MSCHRPRYCLALLTRRSRLFPKTSSISTHQPFPDSVPCSLPHGNKHDRSLDDTVSFSSARLGWHHDPTLYFSARERKEVKWTEHYMG